MSDDVDAYVEACTRFFSSSNPIVRKYPHYCPECEETVPESDNDQEWPHRYANGILVVGCEGYFVVSPSIVGIDCPNWLDWTQDDLGIGESNT